MSNVGKLYYWSEFLHKHYHSIRKKTDKSQVEIINYLWKWFNCIM
jgi:hypothetical protein